MAQYIDKSVLVAEIESKKKYAQTLGDNAINSSMQQFYDGMKQGCVEILSFINTLEVKEAQEEPVSKDLDEAANNALNNVLNTHEIINIRSCLKMFRLGAEWQKEKDESATEDLCEYINELSKQFPEVSFAKLSRIAVRVSKWQEKQDQETIELAEDHAMLAGMNKMEQQMMVKAIDAQCFGFQGAALFSFRLPADNYLVGSKVKVIVIKED